MSNHSRGMMAAIAALIVALPAVASGQTGILHKSSQAMAKSLPAGAVPAAALPGVADGVDVMPTVIDVDIPVDAAGIAVKPLPAPIDATLPTPIDGDGIVHIMPIDDGLVHALPIKDGPGYAVGFEGGAVHALSMGPAEPLPPGLGTAALTAASHAGGLEQAALATAMGGGRSAAHHRAVPGGQPGARRFSERAVGVRPNAVAVPPRGSSPREPRSAASAVQRVGNVQPTTTPRWRDRLRFAWPGTGE